jgi:predicted ATPase
MQILAFQVKNFRSIVDSKWIKLSPDGITVFVGQNESGKSSLLAALACALSYDDPSSDDFRANSEAPNVALSVKATYAEIESEMQKYASFEREAVKNYLKEKDGIIKLNVFWQKIDDERNIFSRSVKIIAPTLELHIAGLKNITKAGKLLAEVLKPNVYEQLETIDQPIHSQEEADQITAISLGHIVWQALPLGVLFNEDEGLLPDTIDINDEGEPFGEGALAAENYLRIADIGLSELMKKERRSREYVLNKANEKVTDDFNLFWSQTIGKTGRLALKCEIDHYDSRHEKAGKPHLTFWILDGHTQLYPRQRSQGVRWFISFYLQLKASEIDGFDRVFLLDEPGANLHTRAQDDVLELINKIRKNNSTVIYSTHSPHLLEYSKLYRVHAIQRDSDVDDSPSVIIGAHELGTASSDTLSPILSAMGANLSSQQVIQRTNNVLLEEMSGYYYLSAFWKLTKASKQAYFIAATGVNKIEPLANMFRGWGLEFIVAVDDDAQGREAYKSIKKNLFGDDENLARKKLLKLPDCPGIEDAFSRPDFCRLILNDASLNFSESNSTYLKMKAISKPVLAYSFSLKVENGTIAIDDFDELTRSKILKITEEISNRL